MRETTMTLESNAAAGQVEEPALAATGEAPELAAAPTAQPELTHEKQRLQEVLPDIIELAQRVGGLRQLAELIDTLEHTRG
jgi:uncharacterized protein involved in copper resistance